MKYLLKFVNKYIEGKEPLNLKKGFSYVGIDFEESKSLNVPLSILEGGNGVKKALEVANMYTVNKIDKGSIFMEGDKIRSDILGYYCRKPFKKPGGGFISEGTEVTIQIFRDGKEISISLAPEYKERDYKYYIKVQDKMTDIQKKLFEAWTNN